MASATRPAVTFGRPLNEPMATACWICMKFQILVNYEPEGTEAAVGSLKTKNRLAKKYKD